MRPAAPGPQLAAGRIRVDAARAIAKLREYRLAEPAAWVLEGIRAAVASGATAIELSADSDEVWLAWDGEPWAGEDLPRLLDELVSPEGDRYHVRLLAAAVNSALGLDPAYVDVIAIGEPEGHAMRVRYTPDVLDGGDALHRVAAETVAPPRGRGMLVHLKRRLEQSYIFAKAPELALAREACRDLRVPITIAGAATSGGHDIVRVPLGDGLDGWAAVVDPGTHPYRTPLVDVAEHGVRLVSYALDTPGARRAHLPIRMYINAPRMPTNASRSQVRREGHPIAEAESRLPGLLPALIAALDDSERARAAVLALLASQAAGPDWRFNVATLPLPFRALASRRVMRDACGVARPPLHPWRSEIHTGGKPFPAELGSRLSEVAWIRPGDPEAALLAGYEPDSRDVRRLARTARKQLRAERRFLEHAPRAPRLAPTRQPRIHVPLGIAVDDSCMPASVFDGLTGDVCIHGEAGEGELIVLLGGRELERRSFESPIAFDVVIEAPQATPDPLFRAVMRDDRYLAIERAMRAGLVRAVESMIVRGVLDEALARFAIGIVRELGGALRGPLAAAPLWRTRTGRVSTAELCAAPVVGVVESAEPWHVPEGRLAVIAKGDERAQLARMLGKRLVAYDRAVGVDDQALVRRVLGSDGLALVIREPGLVAAIAPARSSRCLLYHQGVELDERAYAHALLPCAIAVDADALVPDSQFRSVADTAGLAERDFTAWEIALVRAIARAALGEDTELLGMVEPKLVEPLCEALGSFDPGELLGEPLVEKLRELRCLELLGEPGLHTPREVGARFTGWITFVAPGSLPVAGFTALAGDEELARAVGALCGLGIADGEIELERHQRNVRFERRLAAHRAQPTVPLELSGPRVEITAPFARGVVGAATGRPVLEVLVEQRPFVNLVSQDDLPLHARVDLALDRAGYLERLPDDTVEELWRIVRSAVPELLIGIARESPRLLADPGPVRTLAARFLTRARPTAELRETLAAAEAFPTVQGARVSIARAEHSLGVVSIASWTGEWLDGEPDALDGPVLAITDQSSEILEILDAVHIGMTIDVTAEVSRLQARRRMARGLLPRPRTYGIAAPYLRQLEELVAGRGLGPGEIGLLEQGDTLVQVHEQGHLKQSLSSRVYPGVMLAIEQADRPAQERVQQLACELVREVVKSGVDLSGRLRRNLARALLAGTLDPADLGDTPVLQLADGTWAPWSALLAQRDLFGDVWAAVDQTEPPLDPRRLVFRLDADERKLAERGKLLVVDAAPELLRDALARKNRARPRVDALRLAVDLDLARTTLRGQTRGIVAPLAPGAAASRILRVHRGMVPLGDVEDPCDWPTAAVIDDANLTPDRTWSGPVQDPAWRGAVADVRTASESALASLVAIPDGVLASERVTGASTGRLRAFRNPRELAARGALWLASQPPGARVSVRVIHAGGERAFVPRRGICVGGVIYVHGTGDLDDALEELCTIAHGPLLRSMLARRAELPHDLVVAHATWGLRLGRLVSAEVGDLDLAAPPAAGEPAHPLAPLADAIVHRLSEVGLHRVTIRIAARAEPIVDVDAGVVVLAGENGRLRSLATSLDSPWFPGALDALTAHVVSVLNIALTEITDSTELHALGKLLNRPSAGLPRSHRSS